MICAGERDSVCVSVLLVCLTFAQRKYLQTDGSFFCHITQALEDLRFESTHEFVKIDDAKLEITMAFLDDNGDGRISLQEFKRAVRLEESSRRIVRRWRSTNTRVIFRKLVENTRKFVNFPTEAQVKKFLYLTNGRPGQYDEPKQDVHDGVAAAFPHGHGIYSKSFKSLPLEDDAVAAKARMDKHPKRGTKNQVVHDDTETAGNVARLRPWCGKFEANGDHTDVSYMTVNVPRKGETEDHFNSYNPHLIRYYMERVWKLKRPDVIITVTGGAMAFDMSTEDKDKIMKGMMDGTRNLEAWFITGGTNSGIMQVGCSNLETFFAPCLRRANRQPMQR